MQLSQSVCGWREIYKSYEIMLMLCDCGQWTVSSGAAVAGEQVQDNWTTGQLVKRVLEPSLPLLLLLLLLLQLLDKAWMISDGRILQFVCCLLVDLDSSCFFIFL